MADGPKSNASRRVPETTVVRLTRYLRELQRLASGGRQNVASFELAESLGVNASTLRRDLSLLGTLGTRGSGYEVAQLIAALGRNLGTDQRWPLMIVGVGNLGRALARSRGFNEGGFSVVALVDVDRAIVGEVLEGITVTHLDRIAETAVESGVLIGVVATPPNVAQEVTERLVGAGVRRILNFAPVAMSIEGATVRNVDLAAELQLLSFFSVDAAREVLD